MDNLRIASERKTKSGRILGEDMKLSRMEALKSMTINGAKPNGTEHYNGSIETGKDGRLIILDDDILDSGINIDDNLIFHRI